MLFLGGGVFLFLRALQHALAPFLSPPTVALFSPAAWYALWTCLWYGALRVFTSLSAPIAGAAAGLLASLTYLLPGLWLSGLIGFAAAVKLLAGAWAWFLVPIAALLAWLADVLISPSPGTAESGSPKSGAGGSP